jgi:hypothetical protein
MYEVGVWRICGLYDVECVYCVVWCEVFSSKDVGIWMFVDFNDGDVWTYGGK